MLMTNPRASDLIEVPQGPIRPGASSVDTRLTTSAAERVEPDYIEESMFRQLYHTFDSYGYSLDPSVPVAGQSESRIVGDQEAAAARSHETHLTAHQTRAQKRAAAQRRQEELAAIKYHLRDRRTAVERGELTEQQRRSRREMGLPEEELGEGEEGLQVQAPDSDEEGGGAGGEDEEGEEGAAAAGGGGATRRRRRRKGVTIPEGMPADETTTIFHGKKETDYQGRSWVEPPPTLRPDEPGETHTAYLPKKRLHTFSGHTKGVQSIRFFPKYGHLLLSGSMDSRIKIWDVYNQRQCKRTYMGHNAAVRQVRFASDGATFASCSFDKHVKLWDTETGQCKGTFTNDSTPYCVSFYPRDENVFLCGMSNRKVVQFDARSGEIVQEYDYHLGPVNTVTFCDNARRFVSTSDDKQLLVWDYSIPVPIKHISDPSMDAIPTVRMHPSEQFFCGQSMDNTIVTYFVDRFRLHRKKRFTGHVNAGYACEIAFPPSGQYIASGDGRGKLWVWDWKTRKPMSKLQAHDSGPCISADWHPIEASYVATSGWDGLIKLWAAQSAR